MTDEQVHDLATCPHSGALEAPSTVVSISDPSANSAVAVVADEAQVEPTVDIPSVLEVEAIEETIVVNIPPTGIPLEEIERQALIQALTMSGWVQKAAADLLSISPRVMNYKIKTHGIEIPKRQHRRR